MRHNITPEGQKIMRDVQRYFKYRGYNMPDADQAYRFLVSEIGEIGDAMNMLESDEWVRNNPESKHSDVGKEIGDALMMLTMLAIALGHYDPVAEMLKMMASKSFVAGLVGRTVVCTPKDEDFEHEFEGTVIGVAEGFYLVKDSVDDVFMVQLEQINQNP